MTHPGCAIGTEIVSGHTTARIVARQARIAEQPLAKPDLQGVYRTRRRDGSDWLFGHDANGGNVAIGFQRLRERSRSRRRKQQAARDQDAKHRDPAPTVGEPSHTAVSTQDQVRERILARHARRFLVNAIMSTQDYPRYGD